MGRPKSDNPKDVRFQIRADKETMEKLDYCAKRIIPQGVKLYGKELIWFMPKQKNRTNGRSLATRPECSINTDKETLSTFIISQTGFLVKRKEVYIYEKSN